MKDYTTRVELMAIPIVAVIFGIGLVLALAADAGVWAWVLVGARGDRALRRCWSPATRGAIRIRLPTRPRRPRCRAAGHAADGVYRVLVIADESCVDPAFPAQLAAHAGGRTVEALVIAPAIGSRLARWTGDESPTPTRASISTTPSPLSLQRGSRPRARQGRTTRCRRPTTACGSSPPHEIVFVTKPGTGTDWVERGVVETARERYSVPVTHIALPAG